MAARSSHLLKTRTVTRSNWYRSRTRLAAKVVPCISGKRYFTPYHFDEQICPSAGYLQDLLHGPFALAGRAAPESRFTRRPLCAAGAAERGPAWGGSFRIGPSAGGR